MNTLTKAEQIEKLNDQCCLGIGCKVMITADIQALPEEDPDGERDPTTENRKQESQHFTINLQGQTMLVTFTPYLFANYGHLEFKDPHALRRRILVSETGYRSHFVSMHEIEEYNDIESYAKEWVITIMGEKTPDKNQSGLFD